MNKTDTNPHPHSVYIVPSISVKCNDSPDLMDSMRNESSGVAFSNNTVRHSPGMLLGLWCLGSEGKKRPLLTAGLYPIPYFSLGVRLLQQDPIECLFSFICSSNNNIARITGMVERLCQAFGPRLIQLDDVTYHGFPSLQALAGE